MCMRDVHAVYGPTVTRVVGRHAGQVYLPREAREAYIHTGRLGRHIYHGVYLRKARRGIYHRVYLREAGYTTGCT